MHVGITAPAWGLWPSTLVLKAFCVIPPFWIVSPQILPLTASPCWQGVHGISHSPALATAPHIITPNTSPGYSPMSLFGQALQTQPLGCSHSSASSFLVQAKQNSGAKEKNTKTLLTRHVKYFYRPPFHHCIVATFGWDKQPIQCQLLCLILSPSGVLLLGHLQLSAHASCHSTRKAGMHWMKLSQAQEAVPSCIFFLHPQSYTLLYLGIQLSTIKTAWREDAFRGVASALDTVVSEN